MVMNFVNGPKLVTYNVILMLPAVRLVRIILHVQMAVTAPIMETLVARFRTGFIMVARVALISSASVLAIWLVWPYLTTLGLVGSYLLLIPDTRASFFIVPQEVTLTPSAAIGAISVTGGLIFSPPAELNPVQFASTIGIEKFVNGSKHLTIVPLTGSEQTRSVSKTEYEIYRAISYVTPESVLASARTEVRGNLGLLIEKIDLLKPFIHPSMSILHDDWIDALDVSDSESGATTIIVFNKAGTMLADITSVGLSDTALANLLSTLRPAIDYQ